jgi:hypothetical protein
MNTLSRDFVNVDMRGLKSALVRHARAQRLSVSVVVRDAVKVALSACNAPSCTGSDSTAKHDGEPHFVRISVKLTQAELRQLDDASGLAGLCRGSFLSGLIAGVRVLSSGGRVDHVKALISSSSELSTLSRNLHHLTYLLRSAESGPATEYRRMLETLDADVRAHLDLAGNVLSALSPSKAIKSKSVSSEAV